MAIQTIFRYDGKTQESYLINIINNLMVLGKALKHIFKNGRLFVVVHVFCQTLFYQFSFSENKIKPQLELSVRNC